MKVRCKKNTGEYLREYGVNAPADRNVFGRFGASSYTRYDFLEIDREYLVMGIIVFQTYQGFLIDDGDMISVCPCPLFAIVDDRIDPNWHFRLIDVNEQIYPFIQSIFGYFELCSDNNAYENLIVEKDKAAETIYFMRKAELQ